MGRLRRRRRHRRRAIARGEVANFCPPVSSAGRSSPVHRDGAAPPESCNFALWLQLICPACSGKPVSKQPNALEARSGTETGFVIRTEQHATPVGAEDCLSCNFGREEKKKRCVGFGAVDSTVIARCSFAVQTLARATAILDGVFD